MALKRVVWPLGTTQTHRVRTATAPKGPIDEQAGHEGTLRYTQTGDVQFSQNTSTRPSWPAWVKFERTKCSEVAFQKAQQRSYVSMPVWAIVSLTVSVNCHGVARFLSARVALFVRTLIVNMVSAWYRIRCAPRINSWPRTSRAQSCLHAESHSAEGS